MNLFTWGQSPWGQAILRHISWDLFWASLFAGLAFFVAHASYMYLSPHRKRKMILGRITRREYLEHHDPDRWIVRQSMNS